MKIRGYRTDDWHRLCAIHDQARMDELRQADLIEAFLPLDVAAEREGLFDHEVLVAEAEGTPVGFVAYSPPELAWLYVAPGCYRKGIGAGLVRAALDACPTGLSVEVLAGNDAALNFYKSLGFVESGLATGAMPGNEKYAVSVHCLNHEGDLRQPACDSGAVP